MEKNLPNKEADNKAQPVAMNRAARRRLAKVGAKGVMR